LQNRKKKQIRAACTSRAGTRSKRSKKKIWGGQWGAEGKGIESFLDPKEIGRSQKNNKDNVTIRGNWGRSVLARGDWGRGEIHEIQAEDGKIS